MKAIKILLPLIAMTLSSCGTSKSGIVKPSNVGKEVDRKTVAFGDNQVTFEKGMSNETLFDAISYFDTPGFDIIGKNNANFEFKLTSPSDITYSSKGEFRYFIDSGNNRFFSLTTKSGKVSHFYTQKSSPGQIYNYSLLGSKLIYIYGISLEEECEYANENVDNDKANENKDYVHANKCFYNYNTYFCDTYETIIFDNGTTSLEFSVEVSYKITEKYLIVETNRPYGIYAEAYGPESAKLAQYLSAMARSDLFYKQTRYYNFETKLLEYQGLNLKTVTSVLNPGATISFEGKISYIEASDEAMKDYNEISKYVKDNTTKIGLIID